ncbi:hypothetical protein EYR38_003188 [Pleurotus pulmonarius]|nr:hypothetical protein EYR38_003188 [Pleurotus pulmonarius]
MILPPELFHEILQYTDFPEDGKIRFDLRNFALVCKAWYPIAQALLYRSVVLIPYVIPAFCSIIEECPHIYVYIRHLKIYGDVQSIKLLMEPLQKLFKSSNVVSLRLSLDIGNGSFAIPAAPVVHDAANGTREPAEFIQLTRFLGLFPKLKSLDLDRIPDAALNWNAEPQEPLPKLAASLRRLNISLHPHMMDTLLQWLVLDEHIPRVTEVNLSSQNPTDPLPRTVQTFMDALKDGPESVSISLSGPPTAPSLHTGFSENRSLKYISLDLRIGEALSPEWEFFPAMLLASISSTQVEQIDIHIAFCEPLFLAFDWESVNFVLSTPKFAKLTALRIEGSKMEVSREWEDLVWEEEVHEALPYAVEKGILEFT